MINTTYKMFRFKLHHDKGTDNVVISARDEESAIWMIMQMENCPRNAIEKLPSIGDNLIHMPELTLPPNTYSEYK